MKNISLIFVKMIALGVLYTGKCYSQSDKLPPSLQTPTLTPQLTVTPVPKPAPKPTPPVDSHSATPVPA
jgi:hypothetical protein